MVEDGPLTPELYAVLDSYPILHRVRNKTNLGLGLALNAGLKECRNELVARMDTDDCSKPERCEKQLAMIFGKTIFYQLLVLTLTNLLTIFQM